MTHGLPVSGSLVVLCNCLRPTGCLPVLCVPTHRGRRRSRRVRRHGRRSDDYDAALWLLVATYYRIDEEVLSIRCGPFFWRIPLKETESIRRSRSSLSSPALSLDRLWIRYSGGKRILISPKDREEFIHAISAIPDLADRIEPPGPGFRRPHGTRARGTRGTGPVIAVPMIFGLLFALSFAAVIIMQGEKPIRVSIQGGVLAVSGAGRHVQVPMADITNVSLVDLPPRVGRKVNGYNLGSTLRGAFRCNDAGVVVDCQVFVDLDSSPFVVVRQGQRTIRTRLTADSSPAWARTK